MCSSVLEILAGCVRTGLCVGTIEYVRHLYSPSRRIRLAKLRALAEKRRLLLQEFQSLQVVDPKNYPFIPKENQPVLRKIRQKLVRLTDEEVAIHRGTDLDEDPS